MEILTIYSRPDCQCSKDAKDFLDKHKIPFKEIIIGNNPKAEKEMFQKSRQQGTPVLITNDEIIIGFSEKKLLKTFVRKTKKE